MYRSSQIFQIIFLVFLAFSACNPSSTTSEKTTEKTDKAKDEAKQDSKINESATAKTAEKSADIRIVSTAPSTTEFLFALGLGSKIVGVTKYCNFPTEVEKLPKVGGHTDPDLETILALKPTIVVGVDSTRRKKAEDILTKAKIKSVWVKVESVDDVLKVPKQLGEAFGLKSTKTLFDKMSNEIQPLKIESDAQRPSVLVVFGLNPMIVAGPKTYVDELVHRAGGKNIMTSGPAYPQLDNEKLLALNPDLIIDVSFGEHPPLPAQLDAVKKGNAVRLKNLDLMRPSPRIGEMYRFIKDSIAATK